MHKSKEENSYAEAYICSLADQVALTMQFHTQRPASTLKFTTLHSPTHMLYKMAMAASQVAL